MQAVGPAGDTHEPREQVEPPPSAQRVSWVALLKRRWIRSGGGAGTD